MSTPRSGHNGTASLPTWAELEPMAPAIVATMRRYLGQLACILRPGSVVSTDMALWSFAAFLVEAARDVASVAEVTRRHVEDYRPWLAAWPGQNKLRVTLATIAHRLGTLRMFFVRIDGAGTRRRSGCRCSPATFPGRIVRCPRRWLTPRPRNCSAPRRSTNGCSCG